MQDPRKFSLLGIVAWGLIASTAAADTDPRGDRKNLDSDGDGYITQAEWDAVQRRGNAKFADIDSDGDGRISQEELKSRKRKESRDRVRERRN